MSIVNKTSSMLDGSLLIKRLPKGQAVTIQGSSYTFKYYLQLNNKYMHMPWFQRQGESVFIKCELDANAEGPLYGRRASSTAGANIYIYKNGTTHQIQWRKGDEVLKAVDLDSNAHVIGWMEGQDEGTTDISYRYVSPFLDGEVLKNGTSDIKIYDSGYTASGTVLSRVCSFLKDDSTDAASLLSSSSWAIRIYEIMAHSYLTYNTSTRFMFHLYAGLSGSNNRMVSVRRNQSQLPSGVVVGKPNDGIGGSPSEDIVDFPSQGYGVQLHDVKEVAGSGYNDLLAIATDDGGVDYNAGWKAADSGGVDAADSPCVVTINSTNKNFAFYLGNSSSHVPLPSGATLPSTARSYDIGELIKGRKPRWSIFSDGVKFGKYGYKPTAQDTTKIRFNIFYENDGTGNGKIKLENFEGYDTGAIYTPSFDLLGQINIEWHNGIACKTGSVNLLDGNLSSPTALDRECVFALSQESGGLGTVKLGNLPLWNYSASEQNDSPGLSKLQCFGGGLLLKILDEYGAWQNFATMQKSVDDTGDYSSDVPVPLSSDSNSATVAMFKTGGFDCSSVFRNETIEYMKDRLGHYGSASIKASMMLSGGLVSGPTDQEMIDCSELVADKRSSVIGVFDPKNTSASYTPSSGYPGTIYDRIVTGEDGGTATIGSTKYLIGVMKSEGQAWGWDSCYNISVKNASNPSSPFKGVIFPFSLYNSSSGSLLQILGTGKTGVMGFADIAAEKKTQSVTTVDTIDAFESDVTLDRITYNYLTVGMGMAVRGGTYTKSVSGTVTTYNVFADYESSEIVNCKAQLDIHLANGDEASLLFDLYNSTDGEGAPNIIIAVDSSSGSTKIDATVHLLYSDPDSGTLPDTTALTVTVTTARQIVNRFYGFTSVIDTQDNTNYNPPFDQEGMFTADRVMPWNIQGSRSTTIGACLWLWKDLNLTKDGASQRPQDNSAPVPITIHTRFFSSDTGPHIFNVAKDYYAFCPLAEAPFISKTLGDIRRIYCHNAGTLIEHHGSSYRYLDAVLSLWPALSGSYYVIGDQITDSDALNGKTVVVYEDVLHEPKDSAAAVEIARFDVTGLGTSKLYDTFRGYKMEGGTRTNLDYYLKVTTQYQAPMYTRLPTGTLQYGQFGNTGMYRLEMTHSSTNPSSGSLFTFDIIATS